MQKGKLQTLSSFAGDVSPTDVIIRGLSVNREATEGGAANILNVTFRSTIAEDCVTVLNAIVRSYKDFLDVTYRHVSEDTFKLISEAHVVLETRLATKEEKYRSFRLEHPVLWRGKDGMTVSQDRLFKLESKRSTLVDRRVEIEEALAALAKGLKEGQSKEKLLAMISDATAKQSLDIGKTVNAGDDSLTSLVLQEQALLDDFGPDHPQVRLIRKRMDRLRNMSSRLPKDDVPQHDQLQAHIQSLNRELESVKVAEKAAAKQLQSVQAESKELGIIEMTDDMFRKDIAREQQLFESVVKRLQEINLLKDIGGYEVRCIAEAGPAWKIGQKTIPVLVVAAMLGLFTGLGLAFVAEISDKSFRTSEDVRRRLGLPIMGQIPFLPKKEEDIPKGIDSQAPHISATLCVIISPSQEKLRRIEAFERACSSARKARGTRLFKSRAQTWATVKARWRQTWLSRSLKPRKKQFLLTRTFGGQCNITYLDSLQNAA